MFRPLSIFIGLRYTRAKRRNHFISFISLTSMLGIALGILVLITVLSVMNGFDREIEKRVFGMAPAITVSSGVSYITNWQNVEKIIRKVPKVTSTAPFVSGEALLTNSEFVQPVMMSGIDPRQEPKLASKIIVGQLSSLTPQSFGIVLGEELAGRLEANVGDKLMVMIPQVSLSPAGVIPRSKRFTVTGIFRAGSGFGFDLALAFINISDAQKLFQLGNSVTGIHVNTTDFYAAPAISQQLENILGPSARVSNWTNQFGAIFHAVSIEKKMMFYILLLIIAVAVFNMVSSLVMVVNDKEADIAILRTFGATPPMIMRIFMVQGSIIGLTGTLLGIIGGVVLASNVTELVKWIESLFQVQFLSSAVYWVDYLPSELQWLDVLEISFSALFLSFIATLYPAWRASRIEPVEALRYE